MDLAELNWKICIDYLDDAIEALAEMSQCLEAALEDIAELKKEERYE